MINKIKVIFISILIALLPLTSFAAAPDRQNEFLGKRCNTPPKGSGIIAGFFRGWEQTPFQYYGSGYMPVERYRCFQTMNECKTWLFTMNYYYNEKTPDASLCTQF
ncbi:hypothetical protein [Bartonella sp. HY406]|uniref:hypothetical protein n=1 Tax=Bartonella sp. HY406 TaxID=2979331 RepID=UPI0021C9071D|nr:hypothetical protein [Bartonella sp. HY406]UXN02419.1 hypothetical protein N6B01_07915 [Bartonella sp. HY406]